MDFRSDPVQALIEEGLAAQRELARAAAVVAAGAPPGGIEEEALRAALRRRDEVALRLGLATLAWAVRADGVPMGPAEEAPRRAVAEPAVAPAASEAAVEVPADEAPPNEALPTDEVRPTDEVADEELPTEEILPTDEILPADEVAAPVPAPPPAPPASAEALEALVANGLGPKWKKSANDASKHVAAALARIGPPVVVSTPEALADEVARVAREAARLKEWRLVPKETQRRLIGLLSAKARYLQDETGLLAGQPARQLDRAFKAMTRWSAEDRPGAVPGLGRGNKPHHARWWDEMRAEWTALGGAATEAAPVDAAFEALKQALHREGRDEVLARVRALHVAGVHWSDPRLVALLTPHASLLAGAKDLKTLRAQVKRALETEESQVAESDLGGDLPVPPDWPLYALTTGRRAGIVGGDQRGQAQERIQALFRFQTVTWERGEPRKVQALAESIRKRRFDLVFVLRDFVGHNVGDAVIEACRAVDVPFVLVDHGYGVVQCRLALERYLGSRLDAAS